MSDVVLELFRTLVLLGVVFFLVKAGRHRFEFSRRGWNLIVVGFCLLLFGSILDITDNFESLNKYIIIGDTEVEAILEKFVGSLGGVIFLAVGLIRWVPTVQKLSELAGDRTRVLEEANKQLLGEVKKRKQARRELEESRELLRALADNLPAFISLKDPDGRFRFVNQVFEDWVRVKNEDITGKSVHDIYSKEQADTFAEQDRMAIEGRKVISREIDLSYPDGQTRTVISTRFPVFSSQGKVLGLGTINYDVSDLKRAEQELRKSESRYQNVVESAGDAILVHGLNGRFLDVNQQACESLGYTRDELLQLSVPDIEIGADMEMLNTVWNNRQKHAFPLTIEGSHRRKDGSAFPVEVRLGVLEDIDSVRFIAIARDISERRKVDKLKSEFVSTVSHELRTPLTSIKGSLGLILGGAAGEIDSKAQEMVELAAKNSDRLLNLVNDILDIEKLDSDDMEFSFTPENLADLVCQAVEANRGFAEEFNIEFKIMEALPDCIVLCDESRLLQVLSNLMSNAAKFSPVGGNVELSLTRQGEMARVSVKDFGSGVPNNFRERIFQRFSQADSSDARKTSGTGLGLAISKAIIEKHGGTIALESEPGNGATFYFDLPLISGG